MKKTYVFSRDLIVDVPAQGDGDQGSRKFRAGDTVGQGDVLPGCFESLLRVGDLVELTEPTAVPAEPPPAAPAKPKGK